MSLNYGFGKAFELFSNCFKYDVIYSIIISAIVLLIICIMNKKISKYLILIINVVLLFLISKYYFKDIFSFKFSDPINNIYFYYFNSVVFIIIFSIEALLDKLETYDYVFNTIFLIFMAFSLFMTNYLFNSTYIVIYNIFPMIKFGNILVLIYYVTILTKIGYHVILKKTSKGSGKL